MMEAKKKMTCFWDERARDNAPHFIKSDLVDYDKADLDAFFYSGEEDVRCFLAEVDYHPSRQEIMLEIGCGIGRMTRAFASRFSIVYGIDISPEMIAQAQHNLADYSNVHLSISSGTDLKQFGDQYLDFCFSFIVFQHIPDPKITIHYIHEIGRVLKKGGIAYFQVRTDVLPLLQRLRMHIRLRTRLHNFLHPTSREAKYDSAAWRGSRLEVVTLQHAVKEAGLVLDSMRGIGTQYTWVLCHREAGEGVREYE